MAKEIELAGFVESSCDDGPGIRSVLFLQGCSKNCAGCQNVQIKEHGKGRMIEVTELVKQIEKNSYNKKITISGGEPLEQLESLLELVEILKNEKFNICVYTGWKLEFVPDSLIKNIDFLKTGEFIRELQNENLQYVGSSNQHMYEIHNGELKEQVLSIE